MRHQAQPLAAVPPQGAEGRQGRGSPLVAEDTALAVQGARLAGLLHLETGSDEVNECGCRVANRAARARRGKHAATRSGEDAHHFAVCDVLLATGEASRINKPPQDFLFSWVVKKSQLSGLGEENRPGRQMSSDLEFSLSLPVKQLVRSYTGAATPQSPPLTPKTDTAESPPLVLHAHSAVRACRGDPDVPPLLRRYSSSGFSLLHGSRTKPCTGSSIDDIAPGQ